MAVLEEGVIGSGQPAGPAPAPGRRGSRGLRRIVVGMRGASGWALALICMAALFARIQTYPLRHDEQFYIPAGILYTIGGIYRDFGYNQPPNLPLILHLLFGLTGHSHYLLAGRLLIFVAWLAALGLIAVITSGAARSRWVAALCVALFALDPVLLGPAGMTVTNSFLPIPFALLALLLFLAGGRRGGSGAAFFFVSGAAAAIAMGLKINYAFLAPAFGLAALAMPSALPPRRRLVTALLPFIGGLIVGGAPSLIYFLSDPDGFLAHVTRYHRGAQVDYWVTGGRAEDGQAISFAEKLALARTVWLIECGGLIVLSLLFLAVLRGRRAERGRMIDPDDRRAFVLVAALAGLGAAISFVPTPGFPQYYVPPVPFAIVAIAMLHGQLGEEQRAIATPGLIAIALFLALTGAPRLLGDVPGLLHPDQWSGMAVHREAAILTRAIPGDDRPVATLAPLYPLEAGKPVYPELAAGFVLYRVGDFLERTESSHYRHLASPGTIGSVLERQPPSAILVGGEGALDAPFVAFARRHHYALSPIPLVDRRNGPLQLYASPGAERRSPAAPTP